MAPPVLGGALAGLLGMHCAAPGVPAAGPPPVATLVQMLLARLGDVVELAGALRLDGGMPDLFQIGEGGIDHARTRDVEPLGALVQGLDDFVAMARLLGEQP